MQFHIKTDQKDVIYVQQANNNLSNKINKAGKRFAKDTKVLDKIEINAKQKCFITLKDHKENFVIIKRTL